MFYYEENEQDDSDNTTEPQLNGIDIMDLIVPSRNPYYERYYLLFGGVDEPKCIDPSDTKKFLGDMGFGVNNPLKKAREGKHIATLIAANYNPNRKDIRYCDFCGCEIYGVEYETLADGRDRCLHCGRTAIKTGEEFTKIFENVRRNMEAFFGIRLNVAVKVEMVNSRTLHKRLGEKFTPTPAYDGRVLGVAIRHRDGSYSLMVENGSPRMASILTMAHELTHIWQYTNWNAKLIRRKYGKRFELQVYEGMAKWVEVQYAYMLNEPALAKRTEIMTACRQDAYGFGFLRYRENYPFSTGTYIEGDTPFMYPDEPLKPEFCGDLTITPPRDDGQGLPDPDDIPPIDGGMGGKPRGGSGTTPGGTGTTPGGTGTTSGGTGATFGGDGFDNALAGPIERDSENRVLYARGTLSEGKQQVYDLFYDALVNFTPEITDFPIELTPDDVHRLFESVMIDHPEIFWFRFNDDSYVDSNGKVVRVELGFRYTKEEAEAATEKIMESIQPFIESINDSMSDFEVVLRAYETLVNLVDYDTLTLDKQDLQTPRERRSKPDPIRTVYGVFVDKKAVCAGYARAFQLILNAVGIESAFVSSGVHAWNLVKLEGDYYHIDVTWADSSNTKASDDGGDAIDYSFFCVTTEEILKLPSHMPTDILVLPDCTAIKCNYYHRFGLYFEHLDEDRMREAVCQFVKRGQRDISFKFASMALRDKAVNELLHGGKMSAMLRYASKETGVKVSAEYNCCAPSTRPVISFNLKNI